MTAGQELARQQLTDIERANPHALEVVSFDAPDDAAGPAIGVISLHCGALQREPGGLPLRERERFVLTISEEFPFVVPEIYMPHKRFAGWPHVFWEQGLCLFQAPDTEWDSADGMFGFIERLWIWLDHGARNQLNPVDLPLHPPATIAGLRSEFTVVARADAPHFDGGRWHGYALFNQVGAHRLDLIGWLPFGVDARPPSPCAPAVLLTFDMPWQMPGKLSDLLALMERAGLNRHAVFALLQLSVLCNEENAPVFFIIGTPQRGLVATGEFRQHLMAWQVDPNMVQSLVLSLEKFSDNEKLRAVGEKGEQLVHDFADLVKVLWCKVMEDRPEATTRRDVDAPSAVWRGKHVCVWGCGALGSHAAYLLAKAGARKLTLVDKGVVTPGLLVRQFYEDSDVGRAKAKALHERLLRMKPDLEVDTVHGNALALVDHAAEWTRGAEIVIDCTASDVLQAKLEYILTTHGAVRVPIVSMMVGRRAERGIVVVAHPKHSGGVKDVFRKAKLCACRNAALAVIRDDFYPTGEVAYFQPEPGCSDATFIGSASDVCGLSASMLNLAAMELASPVDAAAAFFVSRQDVDVGKAPPVIPEAFPADIVIAGDYEFRISPAAWREISAWIRRSRRTRGRSVETGGILFGKRDDTLRIAWVDAASGPPPDSKASAAEFVCGIMGVKEEVERHERETRGSVGFVGMWHTHPDDAPLPSTRDLHGMVQLLTSGAVPLRRCLLLIVGLINRRPVLGSAVFERVRANEDLQRITATLALHEINEQFT